MPRLAGKIAIVTGGAAGIGAAIVKRFVAEGARVAIGDLQGDAGAALATELGDACLFVRTDVAIAADVENLVNSTVEHFGGLHILVNNAGMMGGEGSIIDCAEERFDRLLAVDLKGPWLGMKYALPHLIANGGGSIITTSSHAADMGILYRGGYGAAKNGVQALTRVCAVEYGKHFVRANCIIPGAILTAMVLGGGLERQRSNSAVEDIEKDLATRHVLPRAGYPEDLANAALWLASDESSFVTGQAIAVDGGWSAAARVPVAEMEGGLWNSSANVAVDA